MAGGTSSTKIGSPPGTPGQSDIAAQRLAPGLLVAALLVLAPLPFGSAHGWALASLLISCLFAAALLIGFEGVARTRQGLDPVLLPAGLFLLFLLLQLLPLPPSLLHWMSPRFASRFQEMIGQGEPWFSLSIDPYESLLSMLRLGAYAAVFLVAARAPLPGRGSLLHWAILFSASIAALVACWHWYQGWGTALFGEIAPYTPATDVDRLHWPLVNPNHLAAWMNVGWLLALGAVLHPSLLGGRGSHREVLPQRVFAVFALIVCFTALVGTQSRGGTASALIGLALLGVFWPVRSSAARRLVTILRVVSITGLLGAVAWLGWEAWHPPDSTVVLAALARSDATLQVRLEMVRQALPMVRDSLGFGVGLGAFAEAFPYYQRHPLLFATVNHLHCEPLEWLCDLGVVGIVLLCALGGRFVAGILRHTPEDSRSRRAILAATLGSLLVHSVGDFALRVPAIAAGAAAVLGLLWRDCGSSPPQPPPVPSRLSLGDRAVLAIAFAALLYACTWEWRDELALSSALPGVVPEVTSSKVYEALVWRRLANGESAVDPGLRAVNASPLRASSHRALAYSYRSLKMRERELARAVACAPANRRTRIEHALVLAGIGQLAAASREIEEGFYLDSQFGEEPLLRFVDPTDGRRPFLAAALRGAERRLLESPKMAPDLERFRALALEPVQGVRGPRGD